jgi:Rieske Fe-S protein
MTEWLAAGVLALALFMPLLAAAEPLAIESLKLAPGECLTVDWQTGVRDIELPVMVCRRTAGQLEALVHTPATYDPRLLLATLRNANGWADSRLPSQMLAMRQRLDATPSRSLRDEYFVALQMEPHIGCLLETDGFGEKRAAFRNPCHGNTFDSNGRPLVEPGYFPYPRIFLQLPPHSWREDRLIIGELPPDVAWTAYDLREFDGEKAPAAQLANAAVWGDIDRLDTLVHDKLSPVDIDAVSADLGITPLLIAIARRHHETVRWLLENGANPNAKTRHGTPALEVAKSIGDKASTKLLREHSAVADD